MRNNNPNGCKEKGLKTKIFVKCVTCKGVWEGDEKDFKKIVSGTIALCKKLEKLPDDCEYVTFKCDPCIQIENREYEKEHPEIAIREEDNELNLKGDFIGYHIFITLFNGDIEKWEKQLHEKGREKQLKDDLPFVLWLKKQLQEDKDLINRIRDLVKNT